MDLWKNSIYREAFGEVSGDDDLFDDLVMYLGRNFLEAAGNFHTQNNSSIFSIDARIPFLY